MNTKTQERTYAEHKQVFYDFAVPGGAFVVVAIVLLYILKVHLGALPTSISLSGAILVILASFRMIRGVTYDKLLQYVRDRIKYNVTEVRGAGGEPHKVIMSEVGPGVRGAISATIECPWCTGFWTTLIALFLYYISTATWIVIVLLALSGVASLVQLCANVVGNKYEQLEMQNENMQNQAK